MAGVHRTLTKAKVKGAFGLTAIQQWQVQNNHPLQRPANVFQMTTPAPM
jgi:hypothetical protein